MSGTSGGSFLTGRTGMLHWHVAFHLNWASTVDETPSTNYNSGFSFSWAGWTVTLTPANNSGGSVFTATIAIQTGPAFPGNTSRPVLAYIHSGSPPYRCAGTVSGTWDLYLPWEEVKVVSRLSDSGDAVPADQLLYKRRLQVGQPWSYNVTISNLGTWSCDSGPTSITGDPSTISGSGTTTPTQQSYFDPLQYSGFQHAITPSGTAGYIDSVTVDGVALDFTGNGNYGTDLIGGLRGAVSVTNGVGGSPSCEGIATSEAQTSVNYDGLITQEFQPNFGSNVSIDESWTNPGSTSTIVLPNGVYSASQEFREITLSIDGHNISLSNSAPLPSNFSASINASSAASNNIPANDLTLYLLDDTAWVPTTFTHAANYTVESFSSITGWTASGCTIDSTGGLHISNVTAIGASVQRTNYALDFRNYRYLKFNATANNFQSSGRMLTVTLTDANHNVSKVYIAAFGTDSIDGESDIDIDLCAPQNAPFATDATDTSWATPGWLYGMQEVTGITISGFLPGDDITVTSLVLTREGDVAATFPGWVLPVQMPPPVQDTTHIADVYQLGNDGNRYARLLTDRADGKQAADLPYAIRLGGATSPYSVNDNERLSITDFVSMTNATGPVNLAGTNITPAQQAGLAATTPITQYPSSLTNNSALNYYTGALYAGFLTLDQPGQRANIDTDMTLASLTAWPMYTQIVVYPGMTDPQATTALPVNIRFTKRVFGSLHGLVVGSNGSMADMGVSVSGGPTAAEVDYTNNDGYYRSGPRAPSDNQTATAGPLTAQGNVDDRKWRWLGLGGNPATTPGPGPCPPTGEPFSGQDAG